jgi:maleylpyruvate isomerase
MKLYQGRESSASWRVRWGLALKRVAFEPVYVTIATGEHHDALAAVNPMRQVPTLVLDDGSILTESVAILEWLEETHPTPPLLPEQALARARVRELVQLINSGIHPLQNSLVRATIAGDAEKQRAWAAHWIERGLLAFEQHLAADGGRFCCGDALTLADVFLVPQFRNARRFGLPWEQFPRLLKIWTAALATPEAWATRPEAVGAPEL